MARRGQSRIGEGFLSLVVPEPLFVRFEVLDNWVAGRAPVQRGMLGGDVSQQPTCPQSAHRLRRTHQPPVTSHSAQPAPVGGTAALTPAITVIHAPSLTSVAQKPRHSFTRMAVTWPGAITLLTMRMLLTPLGTP